MKHLAIGMVVIALTVSVLGGFLWVDDTPNDIGYLDGEVQFENLDSRTYNAGSFLVRWNTENGGFLTVKSVENMDKILWSSVPGEAFVMSAKGDTIVEEERGSYNIYNDRISLFTTQVLESIEKSEENILITGHLLSEKSEKVPIPYTLKFFPNGENKLQFKIKIKNENCNRAYLNYKTKPSEQFFGFGEQFTYFNLKGKRVPIFTREQGIGRGKQPLTLLLNLIANSGGDYHTTYAPIPHYITSELKSISLNNYEYTVFDLRDKNRVQIETFTKNISGRIYYGENPKQLIRKYTEVAGRMRSLPEWITSGAVVGLQGGTGDVQNIVSKLKEHETPISALWLQDWVGQRETFLGKQLWWNWELDKGRYPNWDSFRENLTEDNIRIMVYINPYLSDVSEKENYRRNMFEEAKNKGYLVKNEEGNPYMIKNTSFAAGILDLTNPAARSWMREIIQEKIVENIGASGWMADYGEGLPYDTVLSSGVKGAKYHNKYPEEWAELNRNAIENLANGENIVFFTRSGFRKSPKYSTLFWEGDQLVSWDKHDGIKSAVTGLLSSGLSGYSFNHSDIGGFTTVKFPVLSYQRSEELIKRWMELSAFTTIYRTHEGSNPEANVQAYSNENTLEHFARMAKVYKAWEFYRQELVQKASETGLPVVRHPFIHYPNDSEVYNISNQQFMVGSELMVAPVLNEGSSEVDIYLPQGNWVNVWSGKTVSGEKTVRVEAPMGNPAVFYPEDSEVGKKFRKNLEEYGMIENN